MVDLDAVRAALLAPFADAFHCYPYPTGQPETPGLVLPEIERIAYHVVHCATGIEITWRLLVFAADAETQNGLAVIEQAAAAVPFVLEGIALDPPLWSNLVVTDQSNVRRHDNLDALSADFPFTLSI